MLSYRLIARAQLWRMLERREPHRLWNVLPAAQYAAEESLPGSINVPLEEILHGGGYAPKEEPVVVYGAGPRCRLAQRAAEALKRRGHPRVWVYEGGLEAWRDAGLPLGAAVAV